MSFGVVAEFGQCMPLSFVTCLRTVGPRYWGSIVFFVCDCVCVCVRFFLCVWWDLGLRVVDILYASHSLASF